MSTNHCMSIPKKSLGQNFLQHPQIAERIVRAAELPKSETVLEVGPGRGILTRSLLAAGMRVVAVEADGELVEQLSDTFAEEIANKRLTLFHADIRTFDLAKLSEEYHVVANIPYYLTGELIRFLLTAQHKPSSMTLLVQKEVAVRIARQNAKRPKESVLSLSVKVYGNPRYCFTVPRGAFFPSPNVDSAVISIQGIRQDTFESEEAEKRFFTLIKTGFAHPRKMLAKNLESVFGAEQIAAAFERTEVPKNTRPEDVSLDQWRALAAYFESGN